MDSRKSVPAYVKKHKYAAKILNNEGVMENAITGTTIAAKTETEDAAMEVPLLLKQPVIRRYRSRKQKTTTSPTNGIETNFCNPSEHYQVVTYHVLHNEQIGNYNIQTLEPANSNQLIENIPIMSVSDANQQAISENNAILRTEKNEIPQELQPTEAMHVVSSAARMNELMYKLELFLQTNEKNECNDPEFAFGRSVGLMLKSIDDVSNRLKIKAKIYNFLSEELQHI